MPSTQRRTPRRGFTLVEILVVITIIGILASLLVPTIAMALRRSRESAIAFEIKQLEMAVEKFKQDRKLNAYPPDFSKDHAQNAANRVTVLNRFVRQNFRNAGPTYVQAWGSNASNPNELDPAEALYFWLALTQKSSEAPLPLNSANQGWTFFEFEQERLADGDGDGWPEYLPPHGEKVPYVYFESSRYLPPSQANPKPSGYDTDLYTASQHGYRDAGSVRPYYRLLPAAGARGEYQAQNKFQIICAGYDGNFGTQANKAYPTGVGFETPDMDNIATFSGVRLDDKLD